MCYHPDSLLNELVGHCCLVTDGQHDFATQPSVWPTLLASSPYLDANEETGLQETDSLGC